MYLNDIVENVELGHLIRLLQEVHGSQENNSILISNPEF